MKANLNIRQLDQIGLALTQRQEFITDALSRTKSPDLVAYWEKELTTCTETLDLIQDLFQQATESPEPLGWITSEPC